MESTQRGYEPTTDAKQTLQGIGQAGSKNRKDDQYQNDTYRYYKERKSEIEADISRVTVDELIQVEIRDDWQRSLA